MVNKNLIASLSIEDELAYDMVEAAFGSAVADGDMESLVMESIGDFSAGSILTGKVIGKAGDDFVIELGLKSEGILPRNEFDNPDDVEIGDSVEVLVEEQEESASGDISISKRKADRIRGWERIVADNKEGDPVSGKVLRRIKGGLLVDIGVPVFLPASQVDVRRPNDIGIYIGQTVDAQILKIDEVRRNIVISRRKFIENRRSILRKGLLERVKVGDVVEGVVKNITDFGAFVDLGGIDGLLHITDMSWSRVNHPTEMLKLEDRVEVKILNIDYDKEKIALGLKQKDTSPWEDIEAKYPKNTRVKGTVTNIMSYGAFVKIEDGVEGLVHISEMSWTRRINHPSEMVAIGDPAEVVILEINKDKQEISLGMKQIEMNPWDLVAEKYVRGTVIEGAVRNLASYGAFIEIEPGIDGLLHVSDLSWTKKVSHPNEVLKKGDIVKCVVLDVDQEKQRIALGQKQLEEDPWVEAIPSAYQPGMIVKGKVSKITNFGVFVELEEGLEGLLHISEISDHKVEVPTDVVQIGQELEVKILRVDLDDRKIGLSLKRAKWTDAQEQAADRVEKKNAPAPTSGGLGGLGDGFEHMGSDKITFGR